MRTPTPIRENRFERALIGALLLDNAAAARVADLDPADFTDARFGAIFAAMLEAGAAVLPIDPVTVADALGGVSGLESYLQRLLNQTASSANAAYYAGVIRERASVRRAQAALTRAIGTINDPLSGSDEVAAAVGSAQDALLALSRTERREAGLRPMNDAVKEALEAAEQARVSGRGIIGLSTGYYDLDRILGGMRRGGLYVVAAETSRGKTALAVNIAQRVAAAGHRVAFFSLEMPRQELGLRLVAIETRLDLLDLATGRHAPIDAVRAAQAEAALQDLLLDLHLDCNTQQTPASLHAALHHMQPPAELIVVDYLQLVSAGRRTNTRAEEVAYVARALKAIAGEFRAPVLALSQLNRRANERARPVSADLKESSEIEQAADAVMLLHHPDDTPGLVKVYVDKNRQGARLKFTLRWDATCTRFDNYSEAPEPAGVRR